MIDSTDLIFLFYRAKKELQDADSEDAWRLVLADFIGRVGEVINDADSQDAGSRENDPIILELANAVEAGYSAPSNRNIELGKQKIAYMIIMGGSYLADTVITTAMAPNISATRLEELLTERIGWEQCRTKPEAVKRLRDHLGLRTSTAEHRVDNVCKTYGLRLEPGRQFGHPKKGAP